MSELYRHYDSRGRLLYVGISICSIWRLAQHRRAHWFSKIVRVEITRHRSRASALKAELTAIKNEKPLHNVVGRLARTETISTRGTQKTHDRLVGLAKKYGVSQADVIERLIEAAE